MGEKSDPGEHDFSQPPIFLGGSSIRRVVRNRFALLWSAVLSTLAFFVLSFDVYWLQWDSNPYAWLFQKHPWGPIQKLLLLFTIITASIRQFFLKSQDRNIVFGVLLTTTLVLSGPFSLFEKDGLIPFSFQTFLNLFITFSVGMCVIEIFGRGCNYVLQVAWESLPQFAKRPRVTKRPPMRVASEAQDLTEVESTVSNQQFH
jgi:hypothetical protein